MPQTRSLIEINFLTVLAAEVWDQGISKAGFPWVFSPRLLEACLLPVSSQGPASMWLCPNLIFLSYWVRTTLMIWFQLRYPFKDLISKYSHTLRSWGSGLQHVNLSSHVWLFATPWTAARHGALSSASSQNPSSFTSIESVILTISSPVVPVSFCLQSFPASGSFPMSQIFTSGGQSTGASASVLPSHTVCGVFVVRTLEWFFISSSSGPHFVRTLHYDTSILHDPA